MAVREGGHEFGVRRSWWCGAVTAARCSAGSCGGKREGGREVGLRRGGGGQDGVQWRIRP